MEVVLIAAVAANGVIGRDGELPWYYPEDLEHFKQTTMGNPVIMGRKTFEGILARLDEPLPGRTNVILTTRDLDREDIVVADSIEAALDAAAETGSETTYVIGGETVYEQFVDRADRLVLTEIDEPHEGDAYFPELGGEWVEVAREEHAEFAFVEYERAED